LVYPFLPLALKFCAFIIGLGIDAFIMVVAEPTCPPYDLGWCSILARSVYFPQGWGIDGFEVTRGLITVIRG
jgi:hypothetical protein